MAPKEAGKLKTFRANTEGPLKNLESGIGGVSKENLTNLTTKLFKKQGQEDLYG